MPRATTTIKAAFNDWFAGLNHYSGGFPARGTIAGALVVLDRLKLDFDLSIDAHTAKGGSQVQGASGANVAAILSRFGEMRPFLSEGGRTNRGLRGDVAAMLSVLNKTRLVQLPVPERNAILEELQQYLVQKVQEFHSRLRLPFVFDPSKSGWQTISDVLRTAREQGKEGPVSEHLVGAKLALRFPSLKIRNKPFSAADAQAGEHGDFQLHDTVFHVTVAPMPALYEKCGRNLRDGFRVYVIVPERVLAASRELAEQSFSGKLQVLSIESFISQNIDEISEFSAARLKKDLHRLLLAYNDRVNSVEADKSLLIEIPQNLAH